MINFFNVAAKAQQHQGKKKLTQQKAQRNQDFFDSLCEKLNQRIAFSHGEKTVLKT